MVMNKICLNQTNFCSSSREVRGTDRTGYRRSYHATRTASRTDGTDQTADQTALRVIMIKVYMHRDYRS